MKLGFLRGFFLIGLGSIVAGLTLTACKADIILPKARGLDGDYAGLLIISKSTNNAPAVTDTDHVIFSFRLTNPDDSASGTYSHRFDTLTTDTTDTPDFCDMPRGEWVIKNGKLIFSPGAVGVSTCDETLVPTSLIDGAGGSITEVPFGFITINTPPPTEDIGDSLILKQDRLADGIKTEFQLVLTGVPQ